METPGGVEQDAASFIGQYAIVMLPFPAIHNNKPFFAASGSVCNMPAVLAEDWSVQDSVVLHIGNRKCQGEFRPDLYPVLPRDFGKSLCSVLIKNYPGKAHDLDKGELVARLQQVLQ